MLPQRRLELYLAQIAFVIVKTAGNKDVTFKDFMFDHEEEPSEEDVREFFGFKPREK